MRKFGFRQFSTSLAMKESWFMNGQRLIRAAEVLLEQLWVYKSKADKILATIKEFPTEVPDMEAFERSMMEPQISLLLGYSLENFMKGLWVHKNPDAVADTKKLPKEFTEDTGHDLNKLAGFIGITVTESEAELLRVLSEFSRWRGRYAIEKNAERNAEAWAKAANLNIVSSQYPGEVKWPPEVYSVMNKIAAELEETQISEQDVAPQPATGSESDSEGGDKHQQEPEPRPR